MKVYACPPVPVFYRSAKGEESELRAGAKFVVADEDRRAPPAGEVKPEGLAGRLYSEASWPSCCCAPPTPSSTQ